MASPYFDREVIPKSCPLTLKQLDTISPDFEGYEHGYSQALHKEEHQVQEALRITKQGLREKPFETASGGCFHNTLYELHDASGWVENYLLTAKKMLRIMEEILPV